MSAKVGVQIVALILAITSIRAEEQNPDSLTGLGLASDDECLTGNCALNALQRTARSFDPNMPPKSPDGSEGILSKTPAAESDGPDSSTPITSADVSAQADSSSSCSWWRTTSGYSSFNECTGACYNANYGQSCYSGGGCMCGTGGCVGGSVNGYACWTR
mmetsp:Transcript_104445/g.265110  ORF Transcript_104445/g.265110 Transcript_104445/m.265110 type:complete len:160 (+) Transcript_104445:97-576(+)